MRSTVPFPSMTLRFATFGLLAMLCSAQAAQAEPLPAKGSNAAAGEKKGCETSRTVGIVLYPMFELLDVYGPAEVFGNVTSGLKVVTVAEKAGPVTSAQGLKSIADFGFDDCPRLDLVLVPGGMGTLAEVKNPAMLDWLRQQAKSAEILMSVCSGSAVLAEAGLLDGRKATSNKKYFQFAVDHGPKVQWIQKARWVDDGNRVTSSGVSAGIDMSLAVVARLYGTEMADKIALLTEYQWHKDADNDPFFRE